MKASTVKEAWDIANRLFPTDYLKDDRVSERAGYPVYYSTALKDEAHYNDHINDLNARLELCIGNECINIWIEEKEDKEITFLKLFTTDELLRILYQAKKTALSEATAAHDFAEEHPFAMELSKQKSAEYHSLKQKIRKVEEIAKVQATI